MELKMAVDEMKKDEALEDQQGLAEAIGLLAISTQEQSIPEPIVEQLVASVAGKSRPNQLIKFQLPPK